MKWSAEVKKNEDKDVGLPEEMTKKGQRSDIQLDQRLRTVPPSKVSETAPTMVICGTDVSVVTCKAKFTKFVETWVDSEPDTDKQMTRRDNNAPTYMQILAEIASIQNPFLEVNCGHIENFDTDLYSQLICYPQEVIHTFDMAVNELFLEKFPDITLTHEIKVRLYSADKTKNLRTLGPEDINKLITITGLVTRASDFVTEMKEAVFRCSVCHSVCSSNHSCSLVHNRSRFSDKLLMQLQESPDSIPAGQIPHTKVMLVPGYVMEAVQPGDRVSVTGVFRAFPMRPSPIIRNIGSVYKTLIDVVYIRKTDKGKENEDIKKSILLQALPNKTTCWSPQDLAHYKLNAYFSNKVEEVGFYVFDPQYYQNTEPFRESLRQATGITDNTHLVSEYFKMYPDNFKFTYHSAYIASISKQPGDFYNCTSTTVSKVIVCMKKTDNPRKTQFDGKQRPDVPSTENPGIRACANSEQVDQEEEEILKMSHLKVAFIFSGSRRITNVIEKMSERVENLQIAIFEPEDCQTVQEVAEQAKIELSVLKPRLEVLVSEDDSDLSQADFIIIAGLHFDFKNDSDFCKIVSKLMRKYLTCPLKADACILVNGSFRGLVTGKIIAEIVPTHKENIHVLDPATFAGSRIFGDSSQDGILYSTQNTKTMLAGKNVTSGEKGKKVQSFIAATSKKHFELLEDHMISNAFQLVSDGQEEGLGITGRFPEDSEKEFYEIDGSVPVFLPSSRETDQRIKPSVQKVHGELKAIFSSTP